MFPKLYETITAGTVPQHNGLGVLSDCISCSVEQAANDIYELTMEYPMSGIHAQDLAVGRYIKAKPNYTDNPQLFQIDRIGKVMNGTFTVYAKHISYMLSGYDITSGTASSAVAACLLLQNAASGFTITTDKTTTANFKIHTPASVKSYFVGREGSFLDVFGKADIKYDNFNVQFLVNGGQDRGVTINYGKNLLELSQEIDASNLYTHVRCFYKDGDNDAVVGNKVSTGLQLDVDKCLVVDVSQEYETAPSVSALTQRATKYKNDNNLTTPTNNIKLDFVQSEELSNRVDLFDTVSVYYAALGITREKVKCIRTKWDVIREKYIETEFGDSVTTAVDTLVAASKKLEDTPSTSFMSEAISHATELITGNLGGHVILHDTNGDGKPEELLVMNTDDIETATNVWRLNLGGFGHANSYDGTYGTAITMDGQIVADYITTGTLNAARIKAGILSDTGGKFSLNMTSGVATMKDLNAKNSLVLVNENNLNRGEIRYTTSNGAGLFLKDPNGNTTAHLVAGSNNDAYLSLYTPSGKYVAGLQSREWGGALYVCDKNTGNTRVTAYCNSTNGGLSIYNSSDKNIAALYNYSTTQNGALELKNSNGVTKAWLLVGANGGGLYLYNSSNEIAIRLDMNTNSTGFIILKNGIDLDGNNGRITCVSLVQTSSRKVKDNIKPMTDAQKILELEAVSFDYKDKEQGTDKRGFIAEDVEKILPNLVTPEYKDNDIERPATLDYIGMIPYLQAVIKDQESRIQDLEKRLEALENKLS